MNLTKSPVYAKGTKRKRVPKAISPRSHLEGLVARARAKGPERRYLDWLRDQPSALGTGYDFDWDVGSVCTPAHWRTAKHAGTATKPEFLAIPLRDAEHKLAHQHGDSTIGDRDWWQSQCERHLRLWLVS